MTVADLKAHMMQAMRDKDSVAKTIISNVIASCVNEAVNLGRGPQGELSEEEVTGLLRREVKRLKDAIQQFVDGGREDLADENRAEVAVLERFLPALMSQDELRPIIQAKINELAVTDKSGAGKLVGALMKDLAGKADGVDVKAVVDELLS